MIYCISGYKCWIHEAPQEHRWYICLQYMTVYLNVLVETLMHRGGSYFVSVWSQPLFMPWWTVVFKTEMIDWMTNCVCPCVCDREREKLSNVSDGDSLSVFIGNNVRTRSVRFDRSPRLNLILNRTQKTSLNLSQHCLIFAQWTVNRPHTWQSQFWFNDLIWS